MTPLVRRLHGLHEIFLFVALFMGFFAVTTGGTAGTSPWWLLVGFPLGAAAAHFYHRRELASRSHRRWFNALIVCAVVATGLQYVLTDALDVMVIGTRFVLILTVIKLFDLQGPRDELQIYALSFLTMAAASEVNQQFFYGIFFGLYVLSGTFGLALFHLKTEAARHDQNTPRDSSPFDRVYISTLATISILIFVASVLMFFSFPRIGLGLFSDPSRDSVSIAGFSEEVEVGEHGSVRDNPSVVMRVDFQGDRPTDYSSYRWRARTFDHYDGSGWSQTLSDSRRDAPHSNARDYDLDFLYEPALLETFETEPAQTAEIHLEPLGVEVLPTLWPTDRIELGDVESTMLANASLPSLEYDAYGDLYHTMEQDADLIYEIDIRDTPADSALRRETGRQLSDEQAQRYLQTPDTDRRLQQLAAEVTDDASSNYARAEAVSEHLIAEYEYTLDLPEIRGDDPLAEFLFDHRRGHCEYFATAAAILLREAGVPTRLVNGFLGGTWNDVGDYLTVRHGDAHAWIEVFVPELGWVPIDPTPPIESTFLERAGIIQAVSDTTDAMRRGWTMWFLDYDLDSQLSLVRDVGQALSPGGSDDDEAAEADEEDSAPLPIRPVVFWGGWLLLLLASYWRGKSHPTPRTVRFGAGLIAASAVGAVWTGWFQGWSPLNTGVGAASVLLAGLMPTLLRMRDESTDLREATRLFRAIERRAGRTDHARRPDEGPGHFLERLGDHPDVPARAADEFRRLYLDVRFGGRSLEMTGRRRLERAADTIISAL